MKACETIGYFQLHLFNIPTTLETVMKTKWCDLFVLGLMQCAEEVGLSRMLEAMNSHLAACSRVGFSGFNLVTTKAKTLGTGKKTFLKKIPKHLEQEIAMKFMKPYSDLTDVWSGVKPTVYFRQYSNSSLNALPTKRVRHTKRQSMRNKLYDQLEEHLGRQLKSEKFEEVSQQINYLLLLLERFTEVKLSPMEFAYLKLISFTSSEDPQIDDKE
ncbi:hypothetical protein DICVIV_04168 [Dictyocaulus viviparus]|uniref:Uncharacterized protein n=1 Tax=Dictyocaulus viviparus TaxID=29172 RepID=A0A0D8Y565_DICVI|nr:hypothetical protein DICVIV_04168 [Dictyocaulus viviparus]